MRDFFRKIRGVESIVEYEIEDDTCIFDVYSLNEDGSKGQPFELTDQELSLINEECWTHYDDSCWIDP